MGRFAVLPALVLACGGCAEIIGADFDEKELTGSGGTAGQGGDSTTSTTNGGTGGGTGGSGTGGSGGSGGTCQSGTLQWVTALGAQGGTGFPTVGGASNPGGASLIVLPGGDIVVFGTIAGGQLTSLDTSATAAAVGYDFYIARLDSTGKVVGTTVFGGPLDQRAFGMALQSAVPERALFWGYTDMSPWYWLDTPYTLDQNQSSVVFTAPTAELFDAMPDVVQAGGNVAMFGGAAAGSAGQIYTSVAYSQTMKWLGADYPASEPHGLVVESTPALTNLEIHDCNLSGGLWAPGPITLDAQGKLVVTGTFEGAWCGQDPTPENRVVALHFSEDLASLTLAASANLPSVVRGVAAGATWSWIASANSVTLYVDRFTAPATLEPIIVGQGIMKAASVAVSGDDPIVVAEVDGPLYFAAETVHGAGSYGAAVVRFDGQTGAIEWSTAWDTSSLDLHADDIAVDEVHQQVLVLGRFKFKPTAFNAVTVDLPPGEEFTFVASLCL